MEDNPNKHTKKKKEQISLDMLSIENRRHVAKKVKQLYPGKIPVILSIYKSDENKRAHKVRYIIPESMTIGGFIVKLKEDPNVKRFLSPESSIRTKSLFLFADQSDRLLMISATIQETYQTEQAKDGFLYLSLFEENTFGKK